MLNQYTIFDLKFGLNLVAYLKNYRQAYTFHSYLLFIVTNFDLQPV